MLSYPSSKVVTFLDSIATRWFVLALASSWYAVGIVDTVTVIVNVLVDVSVVLMLDS